MASGVTTVDCEKQVRSWRLLRSLMQLLIPTCNCATILEDQDETRTKYYSPSLMMSSTTITGTIFGYRRGKVRFCIQANANSTNPILLLELAVPTTILAKEMRGGTLRIALESGGDNNNQTLLSTPLWTMYCNGRKVGYAVKRRPSNTDFEALRLMRSVVVGTGVMNCKEFINQEEDDQLMYLRASFHRVRGSDNSESFHLIHPEGDIDQELSVFFFRSRSTSGDTGSGSGIVTVGATKGASGVSDGRYGYYFLYSHVSSFIQPIWAFRKVQEAKPISS